MKEEYGIVTEVGNFGLLEEEFGITNESIRKPKKEEEKEEE